MILIWKGTKNDIKQYMEVFKMLYGNEATMKDIFNIGGNNGNN